MAVRSGAGTGVIVSLVVFILTTIFLLVLTIVFYAGKTEALELTERAASDLEQYVKQTQRNSDVFKAFEQAAAANGQSVAAHLNGRYEDAMRFLNGDASGSLDQVKAAFGRFGVGEGDVVRHVLEEKTRELGTRQTEIDGLKGKLSDRDAELAQKDATIARMNDDHRAEIELVSREITTYREAAEKYGNDVTLTIGQVNDAVDRLKGQYDARIRGLEDELDGANQEVVLLRARVDEYEAIFNEARARATSPELLVDGTVIDVDSGRETIFIDRGKRHRVVLGMTFEVYDDAGSIRVNPRTGVLPRGKASIQVVKVADTTSTCKITRAVPGRPVVRNNVVANAIYDPTYRFKFLVHGKFDVDGDGRPTKAEADYIESLIIDWGGEVVTGTELPGDLDFLVLGEMPPIPPQPPVNATEAQTRIWVNKRMARLQYEELYNRASEAQIPILNANRFFILIGHTDR
jgi:hypothetical protein